MITTSPEQPGRFGSGRRRTELGLLILGALVVISAYFLASLGKSATIPAHVFPFLVAMLVLMGVAHVANRILAPEADPLILPLAALLNGLGYVMIARLDYKLAALQALWSAVGIVAYVATLAVVRFSRDLDRYRYLLGFGGVFMLLLPLVPGIGENINGARLWLRLGPISFQPVELAKIALVIFFASYFVEKRELLSTPTMRLGDRLVPDPRPFGPIILAWAMSILIMGAEHDIGFSLLVFVIFIAMLWMATGRPIYLLIGAVLFVIGAFVAVHLFSQVHVRISTWINPFAHPQGTGYQMVQSQYAMGTGGLSGTGLGLGHPGLIPVVQSDFIFAAFGEELGLLGTASLVMAFVLLVSIGFGIALRARTDFSKLLTAGLVAIFGFQAFFIMAGVVRLLPLTGVTLPFVAYGGSSLLANYVLIALLARISNEQSGASLRQRRFRRQPAAGSNPKTPSTVATPQ